MQGIPVKFVYATCPRKRERERSRRKKKKADRQKRNEPSPKYFCFLRTLFFFSPFFSSAKLVRGSSRRNAVMCFVFHLPPLDSYLFCSFCSRFVLRGKLRRKLKYRTDIVVHQQFLHFVNHLRNDSLTTSACEVTYLVCQSKNCATTQWARS